MKRVVWLAVLALIAGVCSAQRGMRIGPGSLRGFEHGRFPAPNFGPVKLPGGFILTPEQVSVNLGIPPISAIPPLGVNQPAVDVLRLTLPGFNLGVNRILGRRLRSAGSGEFGAYPLLPVVGGYGYGEGPNVIVLQPMQIPMTLSRPAEVVHPILHQYPVGPESTGPQPEFTLAMRDGSTRPAILVWVQDQVLNYLDPSKKRQQIPLSTLDRASTERLNRENNVELHLPD